MPGVAASRRRARAPELVVATYWVGVPAGRRHRQRVRDLAGTASTGTWVTLPGETARIQERHGARVLATRPMTDLEAAERGTAGPGRLGGGDRLPGPQLRWPAAAAARDHRG